MGRRGGRWTLHPAASRCGVSHPIGRRLFLAGLGAGAGLVALGDGVPAALRSWLEGPLGELSPSDGFHFYSVTGSVPSWDRISWRLAVDGLVEHPLSLSIEDLVGAGMRQVTADFHCVSGWSGAAARGAGRSVAAPPHQATVPPQTRASPF